MVRSSRGSRAREALRDATWAGPVYAVHDSIDNLMMRLEVPGLAQQGVDERGLAMVDMGDDRHVADVRAREHGGAFQGVPGVAPGYG